MTRDSESPWLWDAASALHKGHVRDENQDAVLNRCDLGLWAVVDGMGGHHDGATASRRVIAQLDAICWQPQHDLDRRIASVLAALQEVNHELYSASRTADRGVSGATVAVLLAWQDLGAVVWAGDSRVYRQHDHALVALTHDHSQLEEMIRLGMVQREASRDHPAANVVTRAIGAMEHCEPEQAQFRIHADDTFLLCSDGLYNEISTAGIAAALASGSSAQSVSTLYELTLRSPARDNFSLVVVRTREIDDSKTALNPILTP